MNRPEVFRTVCASSLTALLAGCTNLSGLNGSSSYACKAPDGVTCQSVSGTYANAVANNLPSQRTTTTPPARPTETPSSTAAASGQLIPVVSPDATAGMPLRSPPRILRLWFKPWEDADHDLYDQGYVYVKVDGGRWLVDHAQRAIREAYAPVRSPTVSRAEPGAAAREPRGTPRPAKNGNVFPGGPTSAVVTGQTGTADEGAR